MKHYSPNISSFLLSQKAEVRLEEEDLKQSILIDFGMRNQELRGSVLKYYDLSPKGSIKEAMTNFYYFLRKGEQVKEAKSILVTELNECVREMKVEDAEYADSLWDKMYRSCSGQLRRL